LVVADPLEREDVVLIWLQRPPDAWVGQPGDGSGEDHRVAWAHRRVDAEERAGQPVRDRRRRRRLQWREGRARWHAVWHAWWHTLRSAADRRHTSHGVGRR